MTVRETSGRTGVLVQPEQVPGQWRDWSEDGGRGGVGVWVETSEVPMPCRPLGSSGGRCDVWGPASVPSSLLLPFPLVWCPPLHVLACLLPVYWVGEDSNPSLCLPHSINTNTTDPDNNTDFHLTEATVALTTSPVRRDLCSRGIDPVSSRLIHVNFCHSDTELLKILFISWWIKTEFVNQGSWNLGAFRGVDFLEAVITPLIYNSGICH